jgi:SnoaL-like domain
MIISTQMATNDVGEQSGTVKRASDEKAPQARLPLRLALMALLVSMPVFAQPMSSTYTADRLMIEDVLVRYATAHNTTEPALYREVFTKDAKIMTTDGFVVLDGLDAILKSVETDKERFNPQYKAGETHYGTMRHIITNVVVTIKGNTAKTTCYLLNTAMNTTAGKPEILGMGRYEDELVKLDGRWLISKRAMSVEWGNDELSKIIGVGPNTPAKYKRAP